MTTQPSGQPPSTASDVVELLQQLIRSNFEHAASVQTSDTAATYEAVGSVLARCNPAGWTPHARSVPVGQITDQIAASITRCLSSIDRDAPETARLERIRDQIRSLGHA